jgi:hypothetical protein
MHAERSRLRVMYSYVHPWRFTLLAGALLSLLTGRDRAGRRAPRP